MWHIAVLGSTLFAAAGVAIVVLGALVGGPLPPGHRRARPLVIGAAGVALVLLVAEWTAVH